MSDKSLVRFPGVSWTGLKLQDWVEWLTVVLAWPQFCMQIPHLWPFQGQTRSNNCVCYVKIILWDMSDRSLVRFPGVSWTSKKLQGWVEWLTLVLCGCNSACKYHTYDHFRVKQGPITVFVMSKSFFGTCLTEVWWGFPKYLELG